MTLLRYSKFVLCIALTTGAYAQEHATPLPDAPDPQKPAVGVARNVGRKRAMEMLLTGEPIDAATALAWGLVNRVVPAGELDEAVAHFTDILLARSPAVVRKGKEAFYRQIERPLEAAYEETGRAMAANLSLEDASEGIDAFLGKRPPRWGGR